MKLQNKTLIAIAALSAGACIGQACFVAYSSFKKRQPDRILASIKARFSSEAPLQDAWIDKKAQPYQRFSLATKVFRGGLRRYEDGVLVTYEFLADAKTGTVITIDRVAD